MDKFFSQTHCDRCGGELKSRIMSMFNTQCICMNCKEKEMLRDDYQEAVEAEREQVRSGNFNFPGIDQE